MYETLKIPMSQCRLSDPRQTIGIFVGCCPKPDSETGGLGAPLRVEADLSTQARVKAACELTAQPKLGNGRGALERWPRKQALTIGRGAGTEQRGEVGLSHVIERVADRNVCERHPPRHQEVTTLQPLLE